METKVIKKKLADRFSAALPDNYKRRIIFWQDPDGEFSEQIEEFCPDHVKLIDGKLYRSNFPYFDEVLLIPEGTKYLESCAYKDQHNIEKIVFPTSLEYIPWDAFEGCIGLKTVSIPGSVKGIGFGAFSCCRNLKEVILSEGLEIISSGAFSLCENLKYISFPSTLKRLDGSVMELDGYLVLALPSSLQEIDAEWIKSSNVSRIIADSKSGAGMILKKNRIPFIDYKLSEGFVAQNAIYHNMLLFWKGNDSQAVIDENITAIFAYAFVGHNNITDLVLPDTLEEIQDYAFAGCGGIKHIQFGKKLKKIGIKAFSDCKADCVDLPASVTEIGQDAFPKSCVISVGGEMPEYQKHMSELKAMSDSNSELHKKLMKDRRELDDINVQIKKHELEYPKNEKQILNCEQRRKCLESEISKAHSEEEEAIRALIKQQNKLNADIEGLIAERKECAFFSFKRKNVIDTDITNKGEEIRILQDRIKNTEEEYSKKREPLREHLAVVDKEMQQIEAKMDDWKGKELRLNEKKQNIEKQINKSIEEIKTQENKKEVLEKVHKQWEEDYRRAKNAQIIKDLKEEKAQLLKGINIPKLNASRRTFNFKDSSIDEVLLNEGYEKFTEYWNNVQLVALINKYLEGKAEIIRRIREINVLLKLESNSQFEQFEKHVPPLKPDNTIPERFDHLNRLFSTESWEKFKTLTKTVTDNKNKSGVKNDSFFGKSELFCLSDEKKELLLFPYCVLLWESDKQIRVFYYDKVKAIVDYREEEVEGQVPDTAELIREHYLHVNADGSPNRRYKDNPLMKTIRYSTIGFTVGNNKVFSCACKTHDTAVSFVEELNHYTRELTSGGKGSIYQMVVTSSDLEVIEKKIQEITAAEKAEREAVKRKAEEEQRQLFEKRLAEEAAAEERRREIIRRQKEINEERKRQAAEQKEKAEQVARLFGDDFAENADSDGISKTTTVEETAVGSPVHIISNRLISNTVFKVKLKVAQNYVYSTLTVFFADGQGNSISNRKKLIVDESSDGYTLGLPSDSLVIVISNITYPNHVIYPLYQRMPLEIP